MPQKRPFPRICIALGLPDTSALMDHARQEADSGETFLEFRLDHLDHPEQGVKVIREFLKQHPECIILATCRRHQNHGKFNGSVEQQLNILDLAVSAGAQAIDVEIETAEAAAERLNGFRGRSQIIISYHNFETTPQLEHVVKRMTRIPADAYKIVTRRANLRTMRRVLALAKAHSRTPLVVLADGRTGFPHARALPGIRRDVHICRPLATEGLPPDR